MTCMHAVMDSETAAGGVQLALLQVASSLRQPRLHRIVNELLLEHAQIADTD